MELTVAFNTEQRMQFNVSKLSTERASCEVHAFAHALDLPFDHVHSVLKKYGRKTSGCTYRKTYLKAARHLGLRLVSLKRSRTVERFLREHPTGRFVCHMKGHAFAIIDGVIYDTTDTIVRPGTRIREYFAA